MSNSSIEYIREYMRSNLFTESCPTASKILKSSKCFFMAALEIADKHVGWDEDINFSMTIDQLSAVAVSTSHSNTTRNITKLTYLKLLTKLEDKDVDKQKLALAIQSKRVSKGKHTQFYRIEKFTPEHLAEIEEQARKWKENKYTTTSISYEAIYRCEGPRVAGWVFPQYKNKFETKTKVIPRGTTRYSDMKHDTIILAVLHCIETQGYCIVNTLYNTQAMKIQVQKSIPELLNTYDLRCVRCTKEIKEKYNIEVEGWPNVIIKE